MYVCRWEGLGGLVQHVARRVVVAVVCGSARRSTALCCEVQCGDALRPGEARLHRRGDFFVNDYLSVLMSHGENKDTPCGARGVACARAYCTAASSRLVSSKLYRAGGFFHSLRVFALLHTAREEDGHECAGRLSSLLAGPTVRRRNSGRLRRTMGRKRECNFLSCLCNEHPIAPPGVDCHHHHHRHHLQPTTSCRWRWQWRICWCCLRWGTF